MAVIQPPRQADYVLERRFDAMEKRNSMLKSCPSTAGKQKMDSCSAARDALGATAAAGDAEDLDLHLGESFLDHAEFSRSAAGEVDDATLDEWTPVVDLEHHTTACLRLGHPYLGAKRQRLVRGTELVLVVDLAAGGLIAVQAVMVVGGDAGHDLAWLGRH